MGKNIWLGILCCLLLLLPVTVQAAALEKDYPLEQVLVLSRHNIRAPLAGRDSTLARLTPHAWFAWQVAPGELSRRGAELETIMGQYFGQWLEQEGLIGKNEKPAFGEMRFYANSFQRTIATARYFASGMLPVANVTIEHHVSVNEADPVFLPHMEVVSDAFRAQAMAEFESSGAGQEVLEHAERSCPIIEQVLDFDQSVYAREKGRLPEATSAITPVLNGSYSLRTPFGPLIPASDALTLQYYEEKDDLRAAFGHALTTEDWKDIAALKELGINSLFHVPTAAKALAHPLLTVMGEELAVPGRKFTFLCGHDVNLAEVLPALGVEDYLLPGSIEARTPIGAKLVIEKRRGQDGQEYAALSLVYATTRQLRHREMLSLQNPPARVPLRLKGLQANAEGLYPFPDLMQRIHETAKEGRRISGS